MKLIKSISKKIGDFQAKVILTVCFFLVAPFFVFFVKNRQKENQISWTLWATPSDTIDDLRRQY